VKFAWTVLGELPAEAAMKAVADEIRAFADIHAPGRYHDTLTRFWVDLVGHTRSVEGGGARDFKDHLARYPVLLDKRAPEKHYSAELLGSPEARLAFVDPDIRSMP
jgi:hypothetical protein